jgi:hypothetical protein
MLCIKSISFEHLPIQVLPVIKIIAEIIVKTIENTKYFFIPNFNKFITLTII